MHTHSTEGYRHLNEDRPAMSLHLKDQHGPWPEGLRMTDLDFSVLRQLHYGSQHGQTQAERADQARILAKQLSRGNSLNLSRGGPLTPGRYSDTVNGGEFLFFDDASGAEYVCAIYTTR
jgi:hypothetical protein